LHYNASVQHEASLINAFVKHNKRERYLEMVSNPRLRHKFISTLAHFSDFDSQYRASIPSNKLHAANIALELQRRRSPGIVFAISENSALDQRELPLVEALKEIVGCGMGTVLSCIPGQLAFVETEDERFVLERHNRLEKNEYIRFMIELKDDESNVGRGIFQAAAVAVEWGNISGADADELGELRNWFGKNLDRPTSFGRDTLRLGICWVQDQRQRAHCPYLGNGSNPRTKRHLCEKNQNRPSWLRSLRRRMATRRRALPRRHAAEKVASEKP
jgi:hypothetical protein